MKPGSIRTSIDLPRELHQKLRETAARRGCSARSLILKAVEEAVEGGGGMRLARRVDMTEGLTPATGRPVRVGPDEIYDFIEFP